MSVESDIFDALKALVNNRVYPDVAPAKASLPNITYQQVGGLAVSFLEAAVVGRRNGRFQVNVWSKTRAGTATLARQAEDALVASSVLRATPVGAPVAEYEPETGLFGSRQDFSIWFTA